MNDAETLMSEITSDEIFLALRKHPDRFWGKVDRSGGLFGCWPWRGALTHTGKNGISPRGNFHVMLYGVRHTIRASRVALILSTGVEFCDLDAGHSDHCTTTLCCRPSHLSWVTKRQNLSDYASLRKSRRT